MRPLVSTIISKAAPAYLSFEVAGHCGHHCRRGSGAPHPWMWPSPLKTECNPVAWHFWHGRNAAEQYQSLLVSLIRSNCKEEFPYTVSRAKGMLDPQRSNHAQVPKDPKVSSFNMALFRPIVQPSHWSSMSPFRSFSPPPLRHVTADRGSCGRSKCNMVSFVIHLDII